MSGPAKQRIAPGLRWKVEHGGVHNPNCPNPNCPYGSNVPPQPDAPLAPLIPDGEQDTGGEQAGPAVVQLPAEWAELGILIRTTHELVVVIDQRSIANENAISDLEEHENTPGPPGASGPAGPPGDAGAKGDAATIDEAAIDAMSDKAIAALAARLPPLTFQAWLDGKKWGKPMPYRLGTTVGVDSKLLNPINFPVGDKE